MSEKTIGKKSLSAMMAAAVTHITGDSGSGYTIEELGAEYSKARGRKSTSRSAIQSAVGRMIKLGLLRKSGRRGGKNVYEFIERDDGKK